MFCLFYFGTLAVIGLSTPENSYSPLVANYLNFIDPLRSSLLHGSKALLDVFGYKSILADDYTLYLQSGEGIRMVYSCIGYGVMSFWAAFVIANRGNWRKKTVWIFSGLLALWVINILRVALLLLAAKKHWSIPFGWDHHTWFNVVAYSLIFALIYFYDRTNKKLSLQPINKTANQHLHTLS